jgi:hypothetical protein
MITISNCPRSGRVRKVTAKDMSFLESVRQVILKCHISLYDENDQVIETRGVHSYTASLVASDSFVNPSTGKLLTPEQLSAPETLGFEPIQEFDFFMMLKSVPVIVNNLEEAYILERDSEGKLNV